jgi:hypothetical protein
VETAEELLMPIPALEDVLLQREEEKELERRFQSICGDDAQEVSTPEMNNHPVFQRSLRPVKLVQHGQSTERFVNMIRTMRKVTEVTIRRWQRVYDVEGPVEAEESAVSQSPNTSPRSLGEDSALEVSRPKVKYRTFRNSRRRRRTHSPSDDDDDLKDFIYDSKPLRRTSKRSSSPDLQYQPAPFFEPTHFAATQDTNDEDLPDLGDLLGGKTVRAPRSPLKETSLDGNARRAAGQWGKRQVIVDEDSDE